MRATTFGAIYLAATLCVLGLYAGVANAESEFRLEAGAKIMVYHQAIEQCYLDAIQGGKQAVLKSDWCGKVAPYVASLTEFMLNVDPDTLSDADKAWAYSFLDSHAMNQKLKYIIEAVEYPTEGQ